MIALKLHGNVQKSVYSFWPFADIDILAQSVVSSLSMLFLPKYIYFSKVTEIINLLIFQSPITKDAFWTEI